MTTVDEQIKHFIESQFLPARNRNLRMDDPLLENGIIDSLGVLDLVTFVEQQFAISVADDELVPDNFKTIERLAAFVRTKSNNGVGLTPLL